MSEELRVLMDQGDIRFTLTQPLVMQRKLVHPCARLVTQSLSIRLAGSLVLHAPAISDLEDRFHQSVVNQLVRSSDDMKRLIRDVMVPADKILIYWHYLNDPRCPPQLFQYISSSLFVMGLSLERAHQLRRPLGHRVIVLPFFFCNCIWGVCLLNVISIVLFWVVECD